MSFIESIKERAKNDIKTIVLPESMDERVLAAAELILTEKIGYVSYEEIEEILLLCSEIGKKINTLIKRIS